METGAAVDQVMAAIALALRHRKSSVTISSIAPNRPHATSIISHTELEQGSETRIRHLREARQAFHERRAVPTAHPSDSDLPEFVCIPVIPPPKLHLFGAGDDAQPIVRFAAELGWEVHVADGRTHLLRSQRFPEAKKLVTLKYGPPESHPQPMRVIAPAPLVEPGDRAVILTHSYEQDRALLQELLPHHLEYLGILGPLHRTTRIIDEIKDRLGLSREECFARLHAPVGLPLGTGDPSVIALAIVAEIQASGREFAENVRTDWTASSAN
jgi:xanthine/CO dehydrogenase XdhC/CoxF family maturation factor